MGKKCLLLTWVEQLAKYYTNITNILDEILAKYYTNLNENLYNLQILNSLKFYKFLRNHKVVDERLVAFCSSRIVDNVLKTLSGRWSRSILGITLNSEKSSGTAQRIS